MYFGPHGNPLEVGGGPSEDFVHYYAERAKAGVGLQIQSLPVSHRAGLARACPSRDDSVPAFTEVAERIHAEGARLFGQLNYFFDFPGQWAPLTPFTPNFSPSGMQRHHNYGVTRAMTQADIAAMQEAFRRASVNLVKAGYDGIELHAMHAMLGEMFLSPYFNEVNSEVRILPKRIRDGLGLASDASVGLAPSA